MQTPITQTPAPPMTRLHDWPERLAAVVASAQHQPYRLGQHDCLRFTCQCVGAVTGVDLWPQFAGYTSRLQALRTIAAIAPGLGQAVSVVLGMAPVAPLLARRGDVLLYTDAGGEHLGVCFGATAAVLGPQGLAHVPLDHAGFLQAWRVG
jgi:cell wall-associated NlpC family hydrolase